MSTHARHEHHHGRTAHDRLTSSLLLVAGSAALLIAALASILAPAG